KEHEFKDLYARDEDKREYVKDTQIDADFELLFPDEYVNNITERLNLYNQLSNINTDEALEKFETDIHDRFGPLPPQVHDLLNSVRIKWIASKMGLEKVVLKHGKMAGYFIADQQ